MALDRQLAEVAKAPVLRRAGVATRPFGPFGRPSSTRWNWPCGHSSSTVHRSLSLRPSTTPRSSLSRPWNRSLNSRLRWSLGPSSRPRTREVANMLDALKSKAEGEGENANHCESTECHCKNALNKRITDAELKSDETSKGLTSKGRLMRPRWPRCSGGSCRILRHGPWGGWQQLQRAATSAHQGRAGAHQGRVGAHRGRGTEARGWQRGTEARGWQQQVRLQP